MIDAVEGKAIFMIFLLICALYDFRTKKLDIRIILAMLLIEIFWYMFFGADVLKICLGVIPGALLYVLCILTHEAIGRGDALFFVVAGIALGADKCTELLLISFMLAAVFATGILIKSVIKHRNAKGRRMAMLPFVLTAAVGLVCIW